MISKLLSQSVCHKTIKDNKNAKLVKALRLSGECRVVLGASRRRLRAARLVVLGQETSQQAPLVP
jgi:hypothetical protein